jgi:NAD(P)-dependent dehydrogenase (short-subunit alcohol dehydrogenase family)
MQCFMGKLCLLAGNIAMNNELRKPTRERKKEHQISVHKIAKPEVITRVALFLASDKVSYVAGQQYMLRED